MDLDSFVQRVRSLLEPRGPKVANAKVIVRRGLLLIELHGTLEDLDRPADLTVPVVRLAERQQRLHVAGIVLERGLQRPHDFFKALARGRA